MKSEESRHQSAVFDILRLNEKKFPQLRWIHASMNGASASSPAAAATRKRQGQKRGVADIFCPVPMNGKHGLWCELKIKPNSLSADQKLFLTAMAAYGYETHVCWNCDEVLEAIENYLEIRLSR
jgi:hypothetical protein